MVARGNRIVRLVEDAGEQRGEPLLVLIFLRVRDEHIPNEVPFDLGGRQPELISEHGTGVHGDLLVIHREHNQDGAIRVERSPAGGGLASPQAEQIFRILDRGV